jgi:co-chaperonin GroES (HSP10)
MTIDQFTPVNDRILIEVIADEAQKYEGMLAVIDRTQEKSNLAIVKKVSAGYNGTTPFQVGDKVMFLRHAGTVFKLDHFDAKATEYRLVKDVDILGIIKD